MVVRKRVTRLKLAPNIWQTQSALTKTYRSVHNTAYKPHNTCNTCPGTCLSIQPKTLHSPHCRRIHALLSPSLILSAIFAGQVTRSSISYCATHTPPHINLPHHKCLPIHRKTLQSLQLSLDMP